MTMIIDTVSTLEQVANECSACGVCREECPVLDTMGERFLGDIATSIIQGDEDENDRELIVKCALCGLCSAVCPQELNIAAMMREARDILMQRGYTFPESYRFIWVDHDWNVFSLFKDNYQTQKAYEKWFKTECDTLFFPGCMLLNAAPQIVKSAAEWLDGQNLDVGLIDFLCCGAPIVEVGMKKRAEAYAAALWKRISETGAQRIITACPTCHAKLSDYPKNKTVEIQSIFQLMADAGVRIPANKGEIVTVHDSCPDRWGTIGTHVRQILSDHDVREMEHSKEKTICCGSGGIVSAVSAELCESRAQRRLDEVYAAGADACITYCMACAHRLSGSGSEIPVTHLLELIFNSPVDHLKYNEMINSMWDGNIGDQNLYNIQNSKKLGCIK